jgi:transposase-like protein
MSITAVQLESRRIAGEAIAQMKGHIEKSHDFYQVRSSSGDKFYKVTPTQEGWFCSCPDFTVRGVPACKHIFAVQFSLKIRETVKAEREKREVVIGQFNASSCLYCGSNSLKKFGVRHNKDGDIQRFRCLACSKTFSVNIGFEKMKHNPKAITSAMQLYFNGESLRNVAESLALIGAKVSHQTISNWISKYTILMEKYIEKIIPSVGDTWRADEVHMKFKGDKKYLFALMDDETRYWIAQDVAGTKDKADASNLFMKGLQAAQKKPKVLITDGAQSYRDAYRKTLWTHKLETRTRHIRKITLEGTVHNNNKMERLNGEIRDREKVMRGLKNEDTPILRGYQIFHNYIRPHEGLDGRTPAEACGITIEGENKWLTLIQKASLSNRKLTSEGTHV